MKKLSKAAFFFLLSTLPLVSIAEPIASPGELELPAGTPSPTAIPPQSISTPATSTPEKPADPRVSRELKRSAMNISQAWMKEVENAPTPSADIYLLMKNNGTLVDSFMKAAVPASIADDVKLYQTSIKDGKSTDTPILGVVIGQGEEFKFTPDHWIHLRLINVKRPMKPKDAFVMRFEFQRSTPAEMWVEVRSKEDPKTKAKVTTPKEIKLEKPTTSTVNAPASETKVTAPVKK